MKSSNSRTDRHQCWGGFGLNSGILKVSCSGRFQKYSLNSREEAWNTDYVSLFYDLFNSTLSVIHTT
jgi:hypothetical protein